LSCFKESLDSAPSHFTSLVAPWLTGGNLTVNSSPIVSDIEKLFVVEYEVKCDGAESSDSLKQDKTDSVNNRSQSPMNDSSDSLEGVYQIKWAKLFVVEFSGLISGFGEFDCSLPLFVSSVRESLFFKGGNFTISSSFVELLHSS
jgi:hypothetical protein